MLYNNTWRYFLLLFFLSSLTQFSLAQKHYSTNPGFVNNIEFRQNFNIYHWMYGFNYQKEINQKGQLFVKEDFKSSLLRIHKLEKKWKDDQRFLIDYSWRFSPKWVGKMLTSSILFSDKLSGIKNDIKTSFGSIGIQYNPMNVMNVSTLMGYKFDSRFDQRDRGTTYAFEINTPFIELKEYQNKIDFSMSGDNFDVRTNKDISFNYQVNKEFYTDTTDSLSVEWIKKRRDNYDRLETNELFVESLNEELGRIHHKLNYKVSDFTKVNLSSNITSRKTSITSTRIRTSFIPEDNTRSNDPITPETYNIYIPKYDRRSKKDLSSFNQLAIEFKTTNIMDKIKLSYYMENQKNDVPDSLKNSPLSYRFSYVSPDFKISRLSLTNTFNFSFSQTDSILTNFLISIFRYDTPEETNYDDRDELRINASLSEIHHFSPLLKLKLNMGVNLKHLVFIFGEKSADNNWMRIFRLNPEIYYRPNKNIKLYQTFEVLANYVDYDFEQQLTPIDIKSFVFRKFTMQHIISLRLSLLATFSMNYKLELEENGKLFWDRWTEMIITTRQNHYNNAYFDFKVIPGATLSLGAVFLTRKERLHILESTNNSSVPANNNYISYGPSVKIWYEPHSRLKFTLSGTRRAIIRARHKRYFINNMNINLSWYM